MCVGVEAVSSRMAACSEHDQLGIENGRLGVSDVVCRYTVRFAVFVKQVCTVPLVKYFDTGTECLLVDRLKDGKPGSVFGIAGSRLTLASKRSNSNVALFIS